MRENEPMKFIPRTPSAQPTPKAALATRRLRLQPAPDVPPVAPKPADSPAAPRETSVPAPITLPPAATGSQRLRLRPAPDVPPARSIVSAAVSGEPAPVEAPVTESKQLPPAPPPEDELFSSPVPEPPAVPESFDAPPPALDEQPPGAVSSAPEPFTDDRPMRITTKRLPNIFASAPSARWVSSSGSASPPLRLIPAAALAAAAPPSVPPEPSFPAPVEAIDSISNQPPEIAPEEIAPAHEAPPSPPALRAKSIFPTSLPPKAKEPDTVSTPPVSSQRLTAPPVPLSRLKGGEPHTLNRGFWILLVILAVGLVGGLSYFGLPPQVIVEQVFNHEQKPPVVACGLARLTTPQVELPLPGTIEAFQEASVYAGTSGYVKKWLADIGDEVREGQPLAELDTPEIDQQLVAARVAADQAKANLAIVQSAASSWSASAPAHPVSQEDLDEKKITTTEAQANFDAAQANVARLVDLGKFKEVRAPFSGKITYRRIDLNGPVSAGPAAAHGELFRIAQTDPLRVFVEVPETNASEIKPGVQANIQVT